MKALLEKIDSKEAVVGIVGLGYVGLPLAIAFAECGFRVVGYDSDQDKPAKLRRAVSYLSHVDPKEFSTHVDSGRLAFAAGFEALKCCDAFIVCVPTPLTPNREPDLSFIEDAAKGLRCCSEPGKLFVLESSTYPGTTRDVFARILTEEKKLEPGRDIFVAHSPERQDPGNQRFKTRNVPKVVGGLTRNCLCVASRLYRKVIDVVVDVEDAETAEMVKIFENTYRLVNISLVNEMKVLCQRMGIDVWSVVKAAATKPFGFQSFKPGPGTGGHCFVPGTPVLTENGPVPIEEVKEGDFVLTEGGVLRKVLQTFERDYDGEVITVKVRGMLPVTMTKDHGVYAALDGSPPRKGRTPRPMNGKTVADMLGELCKVPAEELLEKRHCIASPVPKGIPFVFPDHATRAYLELAGWYLSEGNLVTAHKEDGTVKGIRVQASICGDHVDDIARVKELLPEVVGQFNANLPPNPSRDRSEVRIQDRGTCVVLRQGCTPLGEALLQDFGQHAKNKRIPSWLLWSNDLEGICLLMRGMFRGDGYSFKDYAGISYCTISPALAYGVAIFLGRLGIHFTMSMQRYEEKQDAYSISVRSGVHVAKLSELIDFPLKHEPKDFDMRSIDRGDGNVYRRVDLVIRSTYQGKVYNLHVEETNKYVVPIGLVANCLPVDPFYLTWKARQVDTATRFIELAGEVNAEMPRYVAERVSRALNEHNKSVQNSNLLVLGVAYKADVNDVRESPAIKVIELLHRMGASIEYHDPRIPEVDYHGLKIHSVALTSERVKAVDAVVVLTDHTDVDYAKVAELAKIVVDTRCVEALRSIGTRRYYTA